MFHLGCQSRFCLCVGTQYQVENHLVYVGNDWETIQSLDARVKAPALLIELGGRVHNKTGICITGWIIFYLYAWNLDRWKSEFDTIGQMWIQCGIDDSYCVFIFFGKIIGHPTLTLLMRKLPLKKVKLWARDTFWVSGRIYAHFQASEHPAQWCSHHITPRDKAILEKKNTLSSSLLILQFKTESSVDADFSIFFSSASPFLGRLLTKISVFLLFVPSWRHGRAYDGPRMEINEQMSPCPSPLLAQLKKKQKNRNKDISCVCITASPADRDEKLCILSYS